MSLLQHLIALICSTLFTFGSAGASPVARSESASTAVHASASPLHGMLGQSGNLRAWIGTADALQQNPDLQPYLPTLSLSRPGVHELGLAAPDGDSLVVVSLLPLAQRTSKLDGYRLGDWPADGLTAGNARYAAPAGLIPVTPENQFTHVSKHFRLADFVTHDQQEVWPKYLALRPPLVDKLELISEELGRRGLPDHLHIMSGFRTPQYNAQGVGPKGGRASHSRHMYGDAADIYVDANDDGVMDDLNHDGKITVADARVLFALAEQIEAQHPDLVGGISAYPANAAHGPFVHVDVRGVRARW